MALNFQQFKTLRDQGLSVEQIKKFESGEHPGQPDLKQQTPKNTDTGGVLGSIKGGLSTLGGEFNKRSEQTGEILGRQDEGTWSKLGQIFGQGTGLGADVIGTGLSTALSAGTRLIPGGETVEKAVGGAFESAIGKVMSSDAAKNTMDAYNKFKQEHPEAAGNLEALGNVVNLAASLYGGKGAGVFTKTGVKTAGEVVGDVAGIAAKGIEKKLAEKPAQEALNVISRDISTSSKKEIEEAAKLGTKGITKPGIFTKPKLVTSAEDTRIAKSVEGIVKESNHPLENIDAVKSEITNLAEQTSSLPKEFDIRRNPNLESKLKDKLNAAKEESSVIFGGDKTLENNYKAVIDEFTKIMSKKGKNLSAVLDARKEFDQVIKQKFPNIFDKFGGDNVRANAVKDIRMAANDFVAEQLPEGNKFKELLSKQSDMYRAVDRIEKKVVPELKSQQYGKLLGLIKKHPFVSAEAALGIGATGSAMAGIVTNPVALSGLALYGSYKLGKKVLTSENVQKGLSSFLKTSAKVLNPEEKQAVQGIIDGIKGGTKSFTEKSKTKVKLFTKK